MRVTGGELRGQRLASPPRGNRLRPTADRVREGLFAILGELEGATVLDLFCGTGALGIEALSRGASHAVLVDRRPSLARRNLERLELGERAEVVGADALRHLRRDSRRYELILCDPPYRLADRLPAQLDPLIPPRLAARGRFVSESAARRPLEVGLPLVAERRYGDTVVRVHAAEAAGG